MFTDIFRKKKVRFDKLTDYGFSLESQWWRYETAIMDGEFTLHVRIRADGTARTEVIERETGEDYFLYKTKATGPYVGDVRAAVQEVLSDIVEKCYEPAVFKTRQALMLIEYVRAFYGDELEFLWTKFPDNAIWRRCDNQKWYAALLTVAGNKIGLETEGTVEIIDLRMKPEDKEALLGREHYYPGWHMNKNNWYTIVLDAGVSDEELKGRLDESYLLAVK